MKGVWIIRRAGAILVVALALLQGCATMSQDSRAGHRMNASHDPLQPLNRRMFTFNMGLYHHVLEPVAKGYKDVTPHFVRTGVSHFFANAVYPYTLLNDFLQGRFRQGFSDLGRFVVNTTLGIVGLFDPAGRMGLPPHKNSFGVTLGVWGVPQGAYLVLPFFGPSSVRNLPEIPLEIITSPFYYITNSAAQWSIAAVGGVNTGYVNSDAVKTVKESASPYYFARNAWEQHERYLIHGGNVSHTQLLNGLGSVLKSSAPHSPQDRH
ncbi:MAG: MlaA family lipoprotein [Acidiferrobacteraceae bacterium]